MTKIGNVHNGNFLMLIELLAEFDPFLSDHIARFGNPGKGNVSYLSFTTYEEFIKLMANKVSSQIINEVIESKYYSVILDSTPDISHIDELSFVIRYVRRGSQPTERFLNFVPNAGHKATDMADVLLELLKKYKLDINLCRGQSYDNARNMSEIYNGLQAKIKEKNPLAVYIPCAAHSLNLVGSSAASVSDKSISFFQLLQNIYTFFSASTKRWDVLEKELSKSK